MRSKKKSPNKKRVSIPLDIGVHRMLKERADRNCRPIQREAEHIIREAVTVAANVEGAENE